MMNMWKIKIGTPHIYIYIYIYFTIDSYLIMLSFKQGSIKYHFLSLWYDSTWYWTQVSLTIGVYAKSQMTSLIYTPLMMAQDRVESISEQINYGTFINQFKPDTIISMRWLERMYKRCVDKWYIYIYILYIYIYIYIYIYACMCVCVCVCVLKRIVFENFTLLSLIY